MKLQDIRKKRKLTQKQLSELSGVPVRMIQQYEIGARKIDGANIGYIFNLACVLNVKFYEILENDELIEKIKSTI